MAAITVNEIKTGQGGAITWTNASASDTLSIASGSETHLLVWNTSGSTQTVTIAPVTTTIPTNGQFPEVTVGNIRTAPDGSAPVSVANNTIAFIPTPPTCYISGTNTITVVGSTTGSTLKYAGVRKV